MQKKTENNHFLLDLSLQCVQGKYKNNSCYINRNDIGEIIGNDKDNKDLTINLPLEDLEKQTFQIFYKSQEYFLKNLCQKKDLYFQRRQLYRCQCFVSSIQQICNYCRFFQLEFFDLFKMKTIQIEYNKKTYQIICYQNQDVQFQNKYTKYHFNKFYKSDSLLKAAQKNKYNFEDFYQKLSKQNREDMFILEVVQSQESYLYMLVQKKQKIKLWSGDTIQIGKNKFVINRLNYAFYQSVGMKKEMEDEISIQANYFCKNLPKLQMSIYCIFDGHNGTEVCNYLKNNFIEKFLCNFEKETCKKNFDYYLAVQTTAKITFKQIDREIFSIIQKKSYEIGSTALIIIISKNCIISVNLGDSRAILSRNNKEIQLTQDQNTKNSLEKQRIIECGGSIIRNRINGTLEVTRSFGDFQFKTLGQTNFQIENMQKDIVSTEPIFTQHFIDYNQDQFLILGSDGVFSSTQNQVFVDTVLQNIKQDPEIQSYQIAQNLIELSQDNNIRQIHYCDNLSIILIFLKRIM